MEKNLFGLESYDRPLGNRFLHATVVPVDDQFLSTITVEEENAVVYRRELRFASLEQAHTDLHAQLHVMDEVPLEDLMNLEAHEDFRWGDHEVLSKMKKKESEEDGEFDTHVEESIGDVLPKSHYLSRRALKLEHYSYRPKVQQADPSFYGQGFRGEERKRKMNDPATWINRTYYYDAGSKPEAEFEGKYKYTTEIPDDKVYDVGVDPQKLIPLARREGGIGTDMNVLEQKIKEAGYFGYRNTRSSMPHVVAVFVTLPLTPVEEPRDPLVGELVLTTVFVKRAGSTENYLQSLGVQPEVIQFVTSQPPDVAKRLVNEVRKNNQITTQQLQEMAMGLSQKQKYEPTYKELALANRYEQIPGMSQWVLLQLKKHRVVRRTPAGGTPPTFPQYEFTYDWPKIQQLAYVAPDVSASAIVDELDSIKDWVRDQQPQLASFDLLQAKLESEKWHLAQVQQGAGNGYKEKNVTYQFKNGWTIQQVRTDNDLKVEGNLMGHCVGSYCEQVSAGSSSIFSLRDPQNTPHVTLEVSGNAVVDPEKGVGIMQAEGEGEESWEQYIPGWEIVQIQGKGNKEPIPEYKAMIKEWFQSLGPGNVKMEGNDSTLYDRLYNADITELADIIWEADSKDANEYGIPRPQEEFDAGSMENIYEFIVGQLERANRREHSYFPRQMNPIAYALADLAWNSDMVRVQGDISQWSVATMGSVAPERVMEVFQKSKSAMAGIWREMDKHQEEFDRWDFDPGFRVEDFETEEKFFEAESEARDAAYGEWLHGGLDMAINARWRERAKETGGKMPYTILEERLKKTAPAQPKRRRRNAA